MLTQKLVSETASSAELSIISSDSGSTCSLTRSQFIPPSIQREKMLIMQFSSDKSPPEFKHLSRLEIYNQIQECVQEFDEIKKLRQKHSDVKMNNGMTGAKAQKINLRDLRRLEAAFMMTNEPTIEVRKQTILVNADPIRAVILRKKCFVLIPDGADSMITLLKQNFMTGDNFSMPGEYDFEIHALDAILNTISRMIQDDYDRNLPDVIDSLDKLGNSHISTSELEKLRYSKDMMSELEAQTNGLRRALMDLLDNDLELKFLHLTSIFENRGVHGSELAEQSEMLLEPFLHGIHSMKTKLELITYRIKNTEAMVMLRLDSSRNYLLSLDIMFTISMLAIAIGTFVTGAFGMNLTSDIEEVPYVFWCIGGGCVLVGFTIITSAYRFLQSRGLLIATSAPLSAGCAHK